MRENRILVKFQTVCLRGRRGIWRCFVAAGQSCGQSHLECWASNVEELKMCDYGLLVISRYVERCGGQHIPISALSEENRLEAFQILTPARCDDVSRLSQLSICANHLKLSNEVFKSLKKKTNCQLEACEKKKDRPVTVHQSWAIFHKTHTHVLPGSPICWAIVAK